MITKFAKLGLVAAVFWVPILGAVPSGIFQHQGASTGGKGRPTELISPVITLFRSTPHSAVVFCMFCTSARSVRRKHFNSLQLVYRLEPQFQKRNCRSSSRTSRPSVARFLRNLRRGPGGSSEAPLTTTDQNNHTNTDTNITITRSHKGVVFSP